MEAQFNSTKQKKTDLISQKEQNVSEFNDQILTLTSQLAQKKAQQTKKDLEIPACVQTHDSLGWQISSTMENITKTREKLKRIENNISELSLIIQGLEVQTSFKNKQARSMDKKVRFLNARVQKLKGTVRVLCRIIPGDGTPVVRAETPQRISIDNPPLKKINGSKERNHFVFDQIFSSGFGCVFGSVEDLVKSAVDGHNVCICVHGSAIGDTWTGFVERSAEYITNRVRGLSQIGWESDVTVTSVAVHNDRVIDLLWGLDYSSVLVDGVSVVSAQEKLGDVLKCVKGEGRHVVIQVRIRSICGEDTDSGEQMTGCLSLVDLCDTGVKDLDEFSEVLCAIGGRSKNVPYKGCRLGRYLESGLSGDCIVQMIVNVSPNFADLGSTIAKLKYGAKICRSRVFKRL